MSAWPRQLPSVTRGHPSMLTPDSLDLMLHSHPLAVDKQSSPQSCPRSLLSKTTFGLQSMPTPDLSYYPSTSHLGCAIAGERTWHTASVNRSLWRHRKRCIVVEASTRGGARGAGGASKLHMELSRDEHWGFGYRAGMKDAMMRPTPRRDGKILTWGRYDT